MLLLYNILIFFITLVSPLIIIIRVLRNKEDPIRFLEKFTIFSQKNKNKNKLIWFHSVSVGELMSIIPLIEKLEKEKKVSQILITSSTLTSSKLFEKFKFKKTIHQFFPIDANFFTNRFVNYWKPSLAIFIDSEIWPSMLNSLENNSINAILLNARISKKSFKRWKLISYFSRSLIKKFNYTYPQNIETKNYLIKLGAKKIKILGNLKFCQKAKENYFLKSDFIKFINKKKIWGAVSTHDGEEKICIMIQKNLMNKVKDILLIIIPRDISRIKRIINEIKETGINYHLHSSAKKIKKNTNIYLVDSYGETDAFLKHCELAFIGKSLTKTGGQNPLEPARNNCKIFHGPNVSNFREIYGLLKKYKITIEIKSAYGLQKKIKFFFKKKQKTKTIKNKINQIGNKIMVNNLDEIKKYI
jgi:3-deoxy-D-manno-octulosonic-acid transferase